MPGQVQVQVQIVYIYGAMGLRRYGRRRGIVLLGRNKEIETSYLSIFFSARSFNNWQVTIKENK